MKRCWIAIDDKAVPVLAVIRISVRALVRSVRRRAPRGASSVAR
jgi:hypothetical protein